MTNENSASSWDRNYLTMAVHQDSGEPDNSASNHTVVMDDDDDDRNDYDGFSSSVQNIPALSFGKRLA